MKKITVTTQARMLRSYRCVNRKTPCYEESSAQLLLCHLWDTLEFHCFPQIPVSHGSSICD